MEMGLIFLNSIMGVINKLGTVKDDMSGLLVIPVQLRRCQGQVNPFLSYRRDRSPRGVIPSEVIFSLHTRKARL